MEDLDLDELDQAVNKMMDKPRGKKSAKKTAPPTHDAPLSVPPRDTAAPVADPVAAVIADESPQQPTSRPASAPVSRPMPQVPPRRRMHPGAMDIIQPSTPKPAPSGRPSRTGVAVTPTQQITPEPVAPPQPKPALTPDDVTEDVLASLSLFDEPAKPQAITKPQQQVQSEPAPKPESDWPDPLDFHDLVSPQKETPPSLEPNEPPASANTTPFVTTKVEKRPLGAYADAKQEPVPDPATPVAVPAEQEKPAFVPDEATTKEDMAETAIHSSHHLFKPGQEPEHDMDELRNMAIPQQYHTAHADPNDAVHSLYDTKEYHAAPQPLHTARHGSGPGLIIAVVVLIVLIIAAVAVGYLMMTGFDITKLF